MLISSSRFLTRVVAALPMIVAPITVLSGSVASVVAAVLLPGDIIVSDQTVSGIFQVDPLTGDRTVFSSNAIGTGSAYNKLSGVAVESTTSILALNTGTLELLRVDPATGDRVVVSSNAVGTGQTFSKPAAIAIESSGDIVVTDEGPGILAILRIDPVTGNRTVVSSLSLGVGTGPGFSKMRGMTIESTGNILVADSTLNAVVRVDPVTGDRTIVSSSAVGIGTNFSKVDAVTVESTGDILVLDSGLLAIHRVDPLTGDRTIVSSTTVGIGIDFVKAKVIGIEANGDILVADEGAGILGIIRVDPVTGDRTIMSNATVGTGTNFAKPRGLTVVPAAGGCMANSDCNDFNPCTSDICNAGTCENTNNAAPCDDGDACTVGDACSGGFCLSGAPQDCTGAGGGCNTASCDPAGLEGNCDTLTPANEGLTCDDGNACSAGETCQTGTCTGGAPTNEGLACNDGNACSVGETCQTGACVGGAPPNCTGAGNDCNAAVCDPAGLEGNCDTQTPFADGTPCIDDTLFCNGLETCAAGVCVSGPAPCDDAIGCTDDTCDEVLDTCTNTTNDANCDDGLFCNGAETCDALLDCQAGTAPNCDDGIGCTDDSCDNVGGTCVNAVNDANCDDALFCNGVETCSATLDCQAGTPPNCIDAIGCTDDSCDEVGDTCVNAVNDANCDDALFCNGVETCDALLDCQAGTPLTCDDLIGCTDDSCDEVGDVCINAVNDVNCDDALFCNGVETCSAALDCQAGIPPCDDAIGCTDDTCDEFLDTCSFTANDANCDNGLFCDGAETCDVLLDCLVGTPPNCDDLVGCTDDSCDEVGNTCVNAVNDANCTDALFCNGVETCSATLDCQAGTPLTCDDLIGCTDDSCDEVGDVCVNAVNDANCDDALFCNGSETCSATLDCQAGTPPNCADAVGCTDDTCDELNDLCVNTANDANCDDALFCNGSETCSATLDCQVGTPPNCDDLVGCTDDSCDAVGDTCVNVVNNTNCPDDLLFCTGTEFCDPVLDCAATGDPCGAQLCDEVADTCGDCLVAADCNDGIACTDDSCVAGTCINATNDANCDNGLFCDGAEVCNAILDCQAGAPPNCNDGIGCTDDTCDEVGDTCVNAVNDANCDDTLFCNGAETCSATLDCQAGTPPDCNDAIGCTDDSCDEVGDTCVNAVNDANCDDALFCNGAETCSATLDCQVGTPPNCDDLVGCTDDSCDEVGDTCVNAVNDANCDDTLFCNGVETCSATLDCQAGTPPNCDDLVGCTIDACDEVGDVCTNTPNDAVCNDTQFCNGVETCSATLDCQAGTPPNCADAVGCTDDTCDELNDLCVNTANDANCDDALFCNGSETCSATLDCQAGTPPNCDDLVGCTDDSCDEVGDTCVNAPNDTLCADALFCNGVETCDPVLDCQASTDPCAINEFCNETTDICDECQLPGDCDDGIFCTDASCVGGACVFSPNDVNCADGLFCNGVETCDVLLDCLFGTSPCGDGVACTDDTCDEVLDTCSHTPNDVNCPDDAAFCNGLEFCDALLDCVSTGDPCLVTEICNETPDVCVVGLDNLVLRTAPGSETTTPGGTITVLLEVANLSAAINGVQVLLRYDPLILSLVDIVPTDLGFAAPSEGWREINEFDTGGDVEWGATINGDSILIDHVVATMTFTVLADGTTSVIVRADEPPVLTKLTRANDSTTILPNTADTGVILSTCDDGLFCNGVEVFLAGACQAGTPPCDDAVGCTIDSCDEAADACINTPNNGACTDDGVFCNGPEVCDPVLDCVSSGDPCTPSICNETTNTCDQCAIDGDCTDGIGCTVDTCVAGSCVFTVNDGLCDDGLFCNGIETCDAALDCQAGTVPCDDGVGCTTDTCDEVADTCLATPDDTACDDGLFCNGAETCDAVLDCQAGTDPCADAVGCTVDTCDDVADTCANTPADSLCTDGQFCNGAETCDPLLDCQPGTDPCDDGIGCTVATCDEFIDTCSQTADDTLCDDGVFCNGAEVCNVVLDCQPGTVPCNDAVGCTDDTCDEVADTCSNVTNDANCDDGLFCNGAETCDAVLDCQIASDPCNDGVGCTIDSCDEVANQCTNTAADGLCQDGQFCNGAETCDALLDCQTGTPPCNDAVGCTDDSCNEVADVCINTANDANCDDGAFCNGTETCDALLDCQAGADPCDDVVACTVDSCNDILDTCTNTPTDSLCDNGQFCDGAETCDALLDCQPGTDPCEDNVGCTVDSCAEVSDTCINTPTDSLCDDGAFCNGFETCDALLDCQAAAPPCDDLVGCTDDTCDEVLDTCSFTPNDVNCDDGLFCNGNEICDAVLDCQATPPPCVDGVPCTDDACFEVSDTCTFTANNANCDDGLFCNGFETCDALLDCQAGTDPCDDGVVCTDDTCDDVGDTCGNTANDANCDNGLFCDGTETCDPVLDCQTGIVPCDDGVTCTDDTCDDVLDTCANAANDANCDNGLFCDGTETCDPVLDCQVGVDPCLPAEFCNDTNDTCDTCVLNSDCDDGDACTADTCTAGVCANTDLFDPATQCCDPATGGTTTLSDGNPCTTDICNADGTVTHIVAGQISVTLKAQGLGTAVTRDVTFTATDCTGSVDTRVIPVDFDSFGNAAITLLNVDAAADSLSVREGHTLRRLRALTFTSCLATVDLAGANQLPAGDFQSATIPQDNIVDINDFSILGSRFNIPVDPTSSLGADATADGVQGLADFTAIQMNFFVLGEGLDTCGGGASVDGDGLLSLDHGALRLSSPRRAATSAVSVERLNLPGAERADLNGDGTIDTRDIREFARRHRIQLLPGFQRKLQKLEARKKRGVARR